MSRLTRSMAPNFGHFDPGPEPETDDDTQDTDVEMADGMDDQMEEPSQESMTVTDDGNPINWDAVTDRDPINNIMENRMIIAIDFGTTFSSVAYTVIPRGVSTYEIDVHKVKCVGNYPGYEPLPGVLDYRQEVPTELWYDDGSMTTQTGHSANDADSDYEAIEDDDSNESSSGDDEPANCEGSQLGHASESDKNSSDQLENPEIAPTTQYWGYQVHQQLNMSNIPRDEARPLTRFKLNLDHKQETEDVRTDVRTIIKTLMRRRIIEKHTDIYTHFLTHLLKHTKYQLETGNKLLPGMYVQYVLCVPAKWPVRACRIMQTALEEAIIQGGLSTSTDSSVQNLFMISEPEAAAECILAEADSEILVSRDCVPDSSTPLRTLNSGMKQSSLLMLAAAQSMLLLTNVTMVILCGCQRRL